MLEELPKGIVNLKRLEVLYLKGCHKLRCMPSGFGRLTRLRRLGLFVVGCGGDGASISELGNLDLISGDMVIRNIKYSENLNDAENFPLKQNCNIQSLVLNRGWEEEEEERSVLDMDKELDVLNPLEPSSGIKALEIVGYGGSHPSHWLMRQSSGTSPFSHLSELHLRNLPNLKYLHRIVELPWLETLWLGGMPNLEELWTTTTGLGNGDRCFPCLSKLTIKDCPKLNVRPYFPPSLESLSLTGSNEQLLSPSLSSGSATGGLVDFPCLKNLELSGMAGSSHASWELLQQGLTGLESLYIHGSNDLMQLPESMRNLRFLELLAISECPAIEILPDWLGELRALRYLDIRMANLRDRKLSELPEGICHLTSFRTLYIYGCSNLRVLPEGIRHLTSLVNLLIQECHALLKLPEAIWELGSLSYLMISHLQGQMSLPGSMQGLTSLQHLNLIDCPALTMLPETLGQLPALESPFIDPKLPWPLILAQLHTTPYFSPEFADLMGFLL